MTSGRVPVPGGELFVDDQGVGHPLVLLHGGTLDHRMWDDQVEPFLRAGYRVIRYDGRGHGYSSTPGPDFAPHDDLRHLFDQLGLSRASLVGLCRGAQVAIDFALTYPAAVEAAVLASPGVSGMRFTDPVILPLLESQAAAARAADAETYVQSFLRAWVDGPQRRAADVAAEVRQRCALMATELFNRHQPPSGVAREVGAIDRLRELEAPLLVLVGDLDSPDIHAVAGEIEAKAQFVASAVVPGTGHAVAMEQPEAFNAAVLTFLERATPTR